MDTEERVENNSVRNNSDKQLQFYKPDQQLVKMFHTTVARSLGCDQFGYFPKLKRVHRAISNVFQNEVILHY